METPFLLTSFLLRGCTQGGKGEIQVGLRELLAVI